MIRASLLAALHSILVLVSIYVAPLSAQVSSETLLAQARSEADAACTADTDPDRLMQVLCAGEIRIGVRGGYPRFATNIGGERAGYEIDLASLIADRLGVTPVLVPVTPVTRISSLSEGRTDLVIATMGHNSVRDVNARFIRPHYYSSETILIGPRWLALNSWQDAADKTVCTTVGNFANALLVERVARVMLFDTPKRLVANLESGTCSLIVQDDSIMVDRLAEADFGGKFERKLGLSEIPWGMATAPVGADRLAAVLDSLSAELHRTGALLDLATVHGIETGFLTRMQALWTQPTCQETASACVLPPLKTDLEPGPVKAIVAAVDLWMHNTFGILYSQFAWELFVNGVAVSLIAVVGVLITTGAIAMVFAAGMRLQNRWLNAALNLLLLIFQGTPPILILVLIATFANAVLFYSPVIALCVAILSIGLVNGAFAGQGIADAWRSLDGQTTGPARRRAAIARAAPQIEAFMTNATRGIAAASFVGVADLTNALNDIASFSRNQAVTYWILLIFYIVVVMCVVHLSRQLRLLLERRLVEE